jgi:hypothetical protein
VDARTFVCATRVRHLSVIVERSRSTTEDCQAPDPGSKGAEAPAGTGTIGQLSLDIYQFSFKKCGELNVRINN